MNKKDTYKTTNEVLIGLQCIYPDVNLLPKVRLVLKRLSFDFFDNKVKFNDLFNLMETFKSFPITPYLKSLVSASGGYERMMTTYKLMDHLSHNSDYESFRLILKYSLMKGEGTTNDSIPFKYSQQEGGQGETVEKILIQWLKGKSEDSRYSYCGGLVDFLLEEDFFEKVDKTMEFYNLFYQGFSQKSLKDFPITPHLKNLVSAPGGHERVMTTYKLMDHLSDNPDYESFRLILKYSLMKGEDTTNDSIPFKYSQQEGGQGETVEKILIQWLKGKSEDSRYSYCGGLVDFLLEEDFFEKVDKTMEFYNLFYQGFSQKSLKDFPITPHLKNLVSAPGGHERVMTTYKLMDHLSDNPDYESFRLILKYSLMKGEDTTNDSIPFKYSQQEGGQGETVEKILIQWLKGKSEDSRYSYCGGLVDFLLEEDFFEKVDKTMEVYNLFYQGFSQKSLKDFPITPYLKNMISTSNSHEKVMMTCKLMDHLSDNSDYESFRLILKYSLMKGEGTTNDSIPFKYSQQEGGQGETVEKILIQWLKGKSEDSRYSYCGGLVDFLLEEDFFEKVDKTMEFYNLFYQGFSQKSLKNFPITPYLKNMISTSNSHEKVMMTCKLMDHLSHNSDYESFRLILKYSLMKGEGTTNDSIPFKYSQQEGGQGETVEKILIQWLKQKSLEPGYGYCEKLVNLLLEEDLFEKVDRIQEFYNFFYQGFSQKSLKNFPITPYLKNMISASNSHEKVMMTCKLMDHLSHNSDYENFRLILKHSLMKGDQRKGTTNDSIPFKYSQQEGGQGETVEKILIQWLKQKSLEPGYGYCEKLVNLLLEEDLFEKVDRIQEFYNFLYQGFSQKSLKDFPITPHLKNLVSAPGGHERVMTTYKLMDHLSDNPDYESFRLILKHSLMKGDQRKGTTNDSIPFKYSQQEGGQGETVEKILIQWLKQKSLEPGYGYCEKLVNLLLEEDLFEKVDRIQEFYNFLYQGFSQKSLKDFPITPHLKNLVSAPGGHERVMTTYKLMDHLSDNPDYESFRLILKHSLMKGDQDETAEKVLIQWLKQKSLEAGYGYCEKLVNLLLENFFSDEDFFEKVDRIQEFYNFLYQGFSQKSLKDFPITPHLKNLVSAPGGHERVMTTYKLMDHLSDNPDYESFRLILKHSLMKGDQDETAEKVLIQWLKQKSLEAGYGYCEKLVNLLLENFFSDEDFFEKVDKTLELYNFLYQGFSQKSLKDFPITPHLKNLVSAPGGHERVMTTYKLMDHLSDNPDYESFRLILKHSLMKGDQDETAEKVLIQWLKQKSLEAGYGYCEKLVNLLLENFFSDEDFFEKVDKTLELYNFLYQGFSQKSLKDFPITPHLKNLVSAPGGHERVMTTYKLMDHLSDNPDYESFRLILKHSLMKGDQDETAEKVLIQWLKQKSLEAGYGYCEKLVNLLLENFFSDEDFFEKVDKTLELYNFLYQNPFLKQLKKAYQHFIFEDSSLQFLNFLYQQDKEKSLFNQIKVVREKHKDFPIHESFSKGQILSKLWARDCLMNLNLDFCKTALVLCGWSGVLSNLLLEKLFHGVASVDKDPDCKPIAIRMNYENYIQGRFNAITKDIFDLKYEKLNLVTNKFSYKSVVNNFDIIINTSCEHIKDFDKWYKLLPKGQFLLLQSNNFFEIEEHTNCVDSLETFKSMAPMGNLMFEGELPLEKYTRFMLIGCK